VPQVILPVILSGGSGTRLWPLSRELLPKQFLALAASGSLFQQAVLRTRGLENVAANPLIVCNQGHRFLVGEQLQAIKTTPATIILEPQGRNTAPAIATAALVAQRQVEDPLLLVLPADHVIANREAFVAAARVAAEAAAGGRLVTFGIVPTRPETGYGYIRRGQSRGSWAVVEEFAEKPDAEKARRYVDSGQYLWNSGMFLFSAKSFLAEVWKHAPKVLEASRRAVEDAKTDGDYTRLGPAFLDAPSDSIDYAVMEKTDKAAVVPLDAGWSDVGSWAALHDVVDRDAAGNAATGDVIVESCRNSYVAARSRLVAAIGLEDVIVVETPDAVLVVSRDHAQSVKHVVDALKANNRSDVLKRAKDT
jgi:mannose-1-phosphate guanylyltransferase / mannose-6-phosphate isomerase